MKIAAGICTYSEPVGLYRCLGSIVDNVDLVVVVHGPFPNFGMKDPTSLDHTRDACAWHRNSDKIVLLDIPEETHENERRNTYLALMKDYDFCITLDSDEYITDADWPLFRENCQKIMDDNSSKPFWLYNLEFIDAHPANSGQFARLFHHPSQVRYYQKHYWFELPTGVIAQGCSDSRKLVDGITIKHDKSHRPPERLKAMEAHQRWLLQYDSQFVTTGKQRII